MTIVRINKYLSTMGICSRRKADELISCGAVSISNLVAKHGDKINTDSDIVKVKGKIISNHEPKYEYWALYKPCGVVSTTYDENGRKTVTDFINTKTKVYPIGRLDADSEGLIILTNDGNFTNQILHPSNGHIKTYEVTATYNNRLNLDDIKNNMEKGISVDNKIMSVYNVIEIKSISIKSIFIKLQLVTGYNRQIRKMCAKMGLHVNKLVRTGINNFNIHKMNLTPGQVIKIKKEDII